MDYYAHYAKLLRRAKQRKLPPGVYTEKHHALPRRLGGSDDPKNLVILTPEEHFVAHLLLIKIFPYSRAMVYAAGLMRKRAKGNKAYGWLRRRFAEAIAVSNRARTPSLETRNKISEGNKGKRRSEAHKHAISRSKRGIKRSEATRLKISQANKGRRFSPEIRAKMVTNALRGKDNPMFGRTHSDEAKAKLRAKNSGKKQTDEVKAKISAATSGKNNPMYGRNHSEVSRERISTSVKNATQMSCPHCEIVTSSGNYARWHGDKCKVKTGHPVKGRPHAHETMQRMSASAKRRPKKTCDHCGIQVDPGNYAKSHGDKCKAKPT